MSKLLIINGTFYPAQYGGAANVVYWITRGLTQTEIQTSVLTTMIGIDTNAVDSPKENSWIQNDNTEVFYCQTKSLQFPKKMLKLIPDQVKQHDIIHVNGLFYAPSLYAAYCALKYNKKVIWSVHGSLSDKALSKGNFKKKLFLRLIKRLKGITFHCTSEKEVEETRKIFKTEKIRLIPVYMELPEKINIQVKDQFCYLGRINEIKGIDRLIKAFSNSTDIKRSKFELIIAGNDDNEYAASLKAMVNELGIESKIKFIGHVSGVEKERLLAESKWFVLPSHSENFGIVVIEALAQGTPVIASKNTPWEILLEKNAGFWIDNDVKSLKKQLESTMELKEEDYNKIQQNTYQVAQSFNIFSNINQWTDLYLM